MATKLGLYRDALRFLGERKLDSLTEAREPRRALDDVYDDALLYCLEQGLWNFAMRTTAIDSSDTITPAFGLTYAFEKPDDWVRTAIMSTEERLNTRLNDGEFSDESGVWYADIDPLYIKYVSSDAEYGLNLGNWPGSFAAYVGAYLAWKIAPTITTSQVSADDLAAIAKRLLISARAKDAVNEGTVYPPVGTWVLARGGGTYNRSRWDRRS